MKRYDKLIFVSNGDTCLGPLAEAILKSKYLLDELEIASRGLVVLFPEPMNPKAEEILKSHGLGMTGHAAAELTEQDLAPRTLLLAMTEALAQKVRDKFESPANVHTLKAYVGEEGDVSSPIGGTLEDYEECYREMEEIIRKLVIELNEEELLC